MIKQVQIKLFCLNLILKSVLEGKNESKEEKIYNLTDL